MDLEETDEFDQLSTLVSGYANISRLALMLGFYQGYTAKEVTDFLDISRAGVQKNIERMVDAELVYRPAADDAPTYALTPIGEFFARLFDISGPALLAAVATVRQTEADIRQELQDSPIADGLSQADEEKLVHTKKWQQVDDQISKLLSLDTEDRTSLEADSTPSRAYAFESSLSAEDILEEIKKEKENE